MKKLFIIICLIIQLTSFNLISYADDIETEDIEINQINEEIIQTASIQEEEPTINSRAAIVIERNTQTILFEKNSNSKKSMASTTKIMSAIIALENGKLEETVEISKKAASTGGSRLELKTGDKITLKDLLYGLMLRSGNDAAVAIAEHIAGDITGFSTLMNNKAKELGLKNTNFVTPHGLDAQEHYTTAYELAILTNYALENKTFQKIVSTKTCTITINGYPKQITNTNELLGYLEGVNGVKTGFTNGAGRCLVTSVNRNGFQIICVVLGADTKKNRTQDSIKLIEYTYKNYELVDITNKIKEEYQKWYEQERIHINIEKGISSFPDTYLEEIPYNKIPIKKGTETDLHVRINNLNSLTALVTRDKQIGTLSLINKQEPVLILKILTKEEIPKKNIIDYLKQLIKTMKTMGQQTV